MKKNYALLLGSPLLSAFGDNAILFIVLGPLTFAFNEGKITASHFVFLCLSITMVLLTFLLKIPPLKSARNVEY